LWKIRDTGLWGKRAGGRMGRLLKYAFFLALVVGVGCYLVLGPPSLEDIVAPPANPNAAVIPDEPTSPASAGSIDEELDYTVAKQLASLSGWRTFLATHPNGAYAQSARAEIARRLGAPAAAPQGAPGASGLAHGLSQRLASLGSYAQIATAKVEQLLLPDEAPASGNPAISEQTPTGEGGDRQSASPVSSAAESAIPATSVVSHDASQETNPADSAERSSAPPAGTDATAGTQLAGLAPDETCQRDEARLAQLRSAPSRDEISAFANELGCARLRPQVLSLMESLAPAPSQDAATATPPGPQVESADSPASPPPAAGVASPESTETCKRDEERLARLGSNPSGDEALRFVKELGCEKLLPQLQRLLHSPDFDASAPVGSSSSSNNLLNPACASEREALDRLRTEPSPEAASVFWRDLKCEGLRPQVRLLMESLNVTPDSVGSAAASVAPSSTTIAAGADSASCPRETAELNRVRATPDFGDAKRFANTVTCNALKPQVARRLESFGQ
jgi:hypothetical protein